MRAIKKIILYSFAIILGLFTILCGILHFCEDDIEQLALNHINKNLKVPIQINQIELRVWKNFPNATLELKNVFIPSIIKDSLTGDTLLFAQRMFIQFDVMNIAKGTYEIEHVEADKGSMYVHIDQQGNNNFDIAKPSEEVNKDEEVSYLLEQIVLNSFRVHFNNQKSNQDYIIAHIAILN